MPSDFGKEEKQTGGKKVIDKRIIKTERAVNAAVFSLLKVHNFGKITVGDFCEEALISRATFYAHFSDKYDLLKWWLQKLLPQDVFLNGEYSEIEKKVNRIIWENKDILKNIVEAADESTISALFDYMLTICDIPSRQDDHGEKYLCNTVVANFYGGGAVAYLLWQVKQDFPPEVPPLNPYVYELVKGLFNRGDE